MGWTRNDGAEERLREMQLREIQERFGALHQRHDRARRRQVRWQALHRNLKPIRDCCCWKFCRCMGHDDAVAVELD